MVWKLDRLSRRKREKADDPLGAEGDSIENVVVDIDKAGHFCSLAILIALLIGMLIGLCNDIRITFFAIQAFIMTLGNHGGSVASLELMRSLAIASAKLDRHRAEQIENEAME